MIHIDKTEDDIIVEVKGNRKSTLSELTALFDCFFKADLDLLNAAIIGSSYGRYVMSQEKTE